MRGLPLEPCKGQSSFLPEADFMISAKFSRRESPRVLRGQTLDLLHLRTSEPPPKASELSLGRACHPECVSVWRWQQAMPPSHGSLNAVGMGCAC